MDISIGTLQLNRSNPGHVGTGNLVDVSKTMYRDQFGNVTNNIPEGVKTKGTFESYLLDAMSSVSDQQINVATLTEKFITDPDSVEAHELTNAMAQAKMSMNLAQTVIDRLVSGWNDLSQNR